MNIIEILPHQPIPDSFRETLERELSAALLANPEFLEKMQVALDAHYDLMMTGTCVYPRSNL